MRAPAARPVRPCLHRARARARQMQASASRIEIVNFDGIAPYTEDGLPLAHAQASTPQIEGTPLNAVHAAVLTLADFAARREKFDVRLATCAMVQDSDKLLAVIETCGGGGFEKFNEWMHTLLLECGRERATAASKGRKLRNHSVDTMPTSELPRGSFKSSARRREN